MKNNLATQLTKFIGREQELTEILQRLSDHRLLTLTGSAGVGKTRLALEAGARSLERHSDGVWVVELAALEDPELVQETVARALGLREQPGRPVLDIVINYCKDKNMLMVLDNCEHLLQACATMVTAMMRIACAVRILATSREPLGVPGEVMWRVPSLSLPTQTKELTMESALEYEGICLFVDRARLKLPEFQLSPENLPEVNHICIQLDGIPLAIELAAAKANALSIAQIAQRLNDRFRVLTGGNRTALPRQQTLFNAIDWSYGLLSQPEQVLWQRLSVFSDGFSLESAEAIGSGDDIGEYDVIELLTNLVEKCVVSADRKGSGVRYRLLESIRQYGLQKLQQSGEMARVRSKHRDWFLAFAEGLPLDPPFEHLQKLEQEQNNVRVALSWSEGDSDVEPLLRLLYASRPLWTDRFVTEGRAWLDRATSTDHHPTEAMVKVLSLTGMVAVIQEDYSGGRSYLERSLKIVRQLGHKPLLSRVLDKLGILYSNSGDYQKAQTALGEALTLAQEINDRRGYASILCNLGLLALWRLEPEVSERLQTECLSVGLETGQLWIVFNAHCNLGLVARYRGDYSKAAEQYIAGLKLWPQTGSPESLAECLEGLAVASGAEGRIKRATVLLGMANSLRSQYGVRLRAPFMMQLEVDWSRVGKRIPELASAEAGVQVKSTTLNQAFEYAMNHHRDEQTHLGGLTQREAEIVRCVVGGLSDREIAAQLVISPRTVDTHLRNIFSKIGVTSRTELAVWAVRSGTW